MENLVRWRHFVSLLFTSMACLAALITLSANPPVIAKRGPEKQMHVSLLAPPPPPKVAPTPPAPPPPPKKPPPKREARHPEHVEPPTPQPVQATPAPSVTAPVTPASPAPVAQDPSAAVEAEYIARARREVEKVKRYPMTKDARLNHPSGEVVVVFTLGRGGNLLDVSVEQSAGGILDRQALVTVRRAEFPPFPAAAWAGQAQHRFRVELNFIPP